MKAFTYERPTTVESAVKRAVEGTATIKANGIDLLDRMKERVDRPDRVVALIDVPGLDTIDRGPDGSLRVGAMATLAQIAASKDVKALSPALSDAAGSAASPQLRNRATLGGNLAQHTRCGYYRLASFPCFKRGDAACPVRAPGGVQETAGIFDNDPCASAHPSSLAPVLGAAGATVVISGPGGERKVALADLYGPVKQGKASDTTLAPGDVITRVEVPALGESSKEAFYEVRQRAAFDWALVSCAVRLETKGGVVSDAKIYLGSVAPTPMRASAAEKAIVGKALDTASATAAGDAAVSNAHPLPGTTYKVDLVRVAVRRALLAAKGA